MFDAGIDYICIIYRYCRQMKPFLRQAAEKFFSEGDVSGRCFIFPNRRSMVFFRKHLAEAAAGGDAPVIAPEMLTINDFFYRIYDVGVTDRVTLLLELYSCYSRLNARAEPLDEFIFWGDVILGDFNDVDKYLVDPVQIFTNVSDFKALQDTWSYLTDRQRKAVEGFVSHFNDRSGKLTVDLGSDNPNVKERFLQIWNILYPLYVSYRERLKSKGLAYEGMVYRDIAEGICGKGETDFTDRLVSVFPRSSRYVFMGLNALNECEKTLMRKMRDKGLAEFCWDYSGKMIRDSRNRSSFFMDDNVREFPQKYVWDEDGLDEPKIRVISVPSSVGQVKQVPSILAEALAEPGTGHDDCAIVLPDEALLMPLLNTVPPEIRDINVTMGYPMTGSEFYTFMSAVSSVQLHIRRMADSSGDVTWSFYYKPVWSLFSSSIFRKIMTEEDAAMVKAVKSDARIYVTEGELSATPLSRMIFTPVLKDLKSTGRSQLDGFAGYLMDVISAVAPLLSDSSDMAVEVEFAKQYWLCLSRLRAIAPEVLPVTYLRILDQLLSGVSVPFNGEPLKGLQIMGPLETRALDFRNLVILSANEGMFPRRSVSSSFIPPELRRGFGLPSYEFQDAVWAYYFYRMITRAENVWLLYDSRTDGLKSGEESRYIRQLEYHFRLPLERYVASAPVKTGAAAAEIPKTEEDIASLYSRELSATVIQSYIECPARFYYQFVRQLSSEEEVSEAMDAAMIGTVYHGTMQKLYSGSKSISRAWLESMSGRTDEIKPVVWELMMEQLHSPEITGRNLVIGDVIVNYVRKTLLRDMELLDRRGVGSFSVLGLELGLRCTFNGFRIKGFIDRLDSFVPGEVRVVDYKTGKVLPEDMQITEEDGTAAVDKLFGPDPFYRKPKIALQLFIYDLLLEKNGLAEGQRVVDSVYSTAKLFSEPPMQAEVGRTFYEAMSSRLCDLLAEMADPSVPFRRTEDLGSCQYCDFRLICGR